MAARGEHPRYGWSKADEIAYLCSSLRNARRKLEEGERRELALRRELRILTRPRPEASDVRSRLQANSSPPPPQLPPTQWCSTQGHAPMIAATVLDQLCADLVQSELAAIVQAAVRSSFATLPVHVVARWPAEMYRQLVDESSRRQFSEGRDDHSMLRDDNLPTRPSTRERVYALARQEVARQDAQSAAEAATRQVQWHSLDPRPVPSCRHITHPPSVGGDCDTGCTGPSAKVERDGTGGGGGRPACCRGGGRVRASQPQSCGHRQRGDGTRV